MAFQVTRKPYSPSARTSPRHWKLHPDTFLHNVFQPSITSGRALLVFIALVLLVAISTSDNGTLITEYPPKPASPPSIPLKETLKDSSSDLAARSTANRNPPDSSAPSSEHSRSAPPAKDSAVHLPESCEDDGDALFDARGTSCVDWKKVVERAYMYVIAANGTRYLVCVPPKNGSTYHLGLMFRILGVTNYDTKQGVHFDFETMDRILLRHYSAAQIASFFRDDSMPRYAMIRNPMTRTLSGYINKFGRLVAKEADKPKAFQDWVLRELGAREAAKTNQHFRPQTEFCGFGSHDLKRKFTLFRVEEPEKYVNFLYDIVPDKFLRDGWPTAENNTFREHVLGPRKRTHDSDNIFLDYVGSLEVFDHIAEFVKSDIEYLGYGKDVKDMRARLEERLRNSQ